jgi:hypothetical protein
MASLNAAIEYQKSLLRGVYDEAIQRYTEALLAGVDDRKAQHDLDAACEIGDNHYTEALNNLTEEVSAPDLNAALANEAVTVATPENPAVAVARLADEDEQHNCNFVVVAQVVD